MRSLPLIALSWLWLPSLGHRPAPSPAPAAHAPVYTSDGRLQPPADYREWIYLSSGLDMSYTPRVAAMPDHHSMFDNVFVTPEAFHAFQATAAWPDKTMFVLEVRGAESNASINKAGHFQGQALMGFEMHVKDSARGGWAFYDFSDSGPGKLLPATEACYSCHRDHAAVDTTFVQFYPTLFPLAKARGTLSPSYLKEAAPPSH